MRVGGFVPTTSERDDASHARRPRCGSAGASCALLAPQGAAPGRGVGCLAQRASDSGRAIHASPAGQLAAAARHDAACDDFASPKAAWPARSGTRRMTPAPMRAESRYPAARPGAILCGARRAPYVGTFPQSSARRPRCGVPRAARRRAAGVALPKPRRAERNTGRKAQPAKPRELTSKAAGPQEAPSAQCRPPRVARREAPRRPPRRRRRPDPVFDRTL